MDSSLDIVHKTVMGVLYLVCSVEALATLGAAVDLQRFVAGLLWYTCSAKL